MFQAFSKLGRSFYNHHLHDAWAPTLLRHKQILDSVDVETPPWERDSTGMWLDVPKSALMIMEEVTFCAPFLAIAHVVQADINAAEAIHSAQHAFLNQFAMAADLRTECKAAEKEYKKAESSRKRPARYSVLVIVSTPPLSSLLVSFSMTLLVEVVALPRKHSTNVKAPRKRTPTFTNRLCSLRNSS